MHLSAGLRKALQRGADFVRDAADTVRVATDGVPVFERLRDIGHGSDGADRPRMLLIGDRAPQPGQWLFDARVVDDLGQALGDMADVILLSGPIPGAPALPASVTPCPAMTEQGYGERTTHWDRLIVTQASRMRAGIVFLLHANEDTLGAIPALKSAGRTVIVAATSADLPLAPRARDGSLNVRQNWARHVRTADLVLTSSTWEEEEIEGLTRGGSTIYPYLRGVDLAAFQPVPRPAAGPLRLLYVADRGGALSLRYVLKAARDLENVAGIEFTILSAQPGANTRNVAHGPLVPYGNRAQLYQEFDAFIAPVECAGFSQSLMEALASGCAAVAPKSYFGDYSEDSPLLTYSVQAGQLAATLLALKFDRAQLTQCQERSVAFAAAYLDRRAWNTWLRGCFEWVEAGAGTTTGRQGQLRNA